MNSADELLWCFSSAFELWKDKFHSRSEVSAAAVGAGDLALTGDLAHSSSSGGVFFLTFCTSEVPALEFLPIPPWQIVRCITVLTTNLLEAFLCLCSPHLLLILRMLKACRQDQLCSPSVPPVARCLRAAAS